MEDDLGEISNPEEKTKLNKSVKKLSLLLEKGVEIYASVNLQKDVQVLFPNISEQDQITDDILKFL